jgi:hypothetical protein
MPTERPRQRQFDLTATELAQFLDFEGSRLALPWEVNPGNGASAPDLWWSPAEPGQPPKAWVNQALTTQQILGRLQRGQAPLELRPSAGQAGAPAMLVRVPESDREFAVEATASGLQQLIHLLHARLRPPAPRAPSAPRRWCPSDYLRLPPGQGRIPRDKVAEYDRHGHRLVAQQVSLEDVIG